jgi:hypothetical protein
LLQYTVHNTSEPPPLDGGWEHPSWQRAETLEINQFRPESSEHHPLTQARFLYTLSAIFGIYRVEDRYVRCAHTEFQDPTHLDSCAEFFVQPRADQGYFNFEFNCGGALLVFYITDWTRLPEGFVKYSHLTRREARMVPVYHSLPELVEPEITEPVTWELAFQIPVALLENYTGEVGSLRGQRWRANAFKCGDGTSHPHWASWSAVDELNFHLPRCFGEFVFAG